MYRAILITAAALLMTTAAHSQNAQYFPMDVGYEWFYDDDMADRIVDLKRVPYDGNEYTLGYFFAPYNYEERIFYRVGNRIYEFRNGYGRLCYDFDAQAGDSWDMSWELLTSVFIIDESGNMIIHPESDIKRVAADGDDPSTSGGESDASGPGNETSPMTPPPEDINTDAVVTVIEDNAVVETPLGTFRDVYHVKIARPHVSDASYIEEWFAPGVGCIMRVWDTIAGPQQQRLVRTSTPTQSSERLRLDISLNKEFYNEREDILIDVTLYNHGEEDVTLDFPTSFQVDYNIDAQYTWSETQTFSQAETSVTIPAGESHTWSFVHAEEDYYLEPGYHKMTARVVGTSLNAAQEVAVMRNTPGLPEDIVLAVELEYDTYRFGETVNYTLHVTNTGTDDAMLDIMESIPVFCRIDMENPDMVIDFSWSSVPFAETVVPAGETVSYEGVCGLDIICLAPGDHTLYAGLYGYTGTASSSFTVTNEIMPARISGLVITPSEAGDEYDTVAGAGIVLRPVVPDGVSRDFICVPNVDYGGEDTLSGEDGTFVFENVPMGYFYNLTVTKEGYYPYNITVRVLMDEVPIRVLLKPMRDEPPEPIDPEKRDVYGIATYFGLDASVYPPGAPFRAVFTVENRREDTVTFTFDQEDFVTWAVIHPDIEPVYYGSGAVREGNATTSHNEQTENTGGEGDLGKAAEYTLTLEPGDLRSFVLEGSFEDDLTRGDAKVMVVAVLEFSTCNIETILPGDLYGTAYAVIEQANWEQVTTRSDDGEAVVDFRTPADTVLDISMNNSDVSGDIRIANIEQNHHGEMHNSRFVRMVNIDADENIANNMGTARIRMYYDPADFGDDFDPNSLFIAHWREQAVAGNLDLDSVADIIDGGEWETLECRVDTINQYVEATTTHFSTFGLFETTSASTDVDDPSEPQEFVVMQNSPNPFNPSTSITFSMPVEGHTKVEIFNINGQIVDTLVDEWRGAGSNTVLWDASSEAAGLYFCRVKSGENSKVMKMMLVK